MRARVLPVRRLTFACTELPSTIGNLKSLKLLEVWGNRLTGEHLCSSNRALTILPAAVPESIGQLQALEMLNLAGNKIAGEHPRSTRTTPHNFLQHRRREGPREGSPPKLQAPPPLRQRGEQRGGTQHGAARRKRRTRARAGGAS